MAKLDDAKPISNGFDLGEDWLGELDDALDFDAQGEDEYAKTAENEVVALEEVLEVVDVESGASSVESDLEVADMFDGDIELFEVETAPAESDFLEVQVSDSIEIKLDEEPEESDVIRESDDARPSVETNGMQDIPTEELPIICEEDDHFFDSDAAKNVESRPASPSAAEKGNETGSSKGRAVVARTLDIATLQHQAEIRQKAQDASRTDEDPLKDPQLWQFVSLIAMRLFDDLELLLVQKHCDEACDLVKQFNRLSNILAFAGLGELLPLIAYLGNLLPVSFTDVEIGEASERRFDPLKMRRYTEKNNEFLNCLVYLLNYLSKRAVGFDTGRFTDSLERMYSALELQPGQPSVDAPLAITDNVNPHELTTRTVNKLSRTIEALVTESLHYIESGVFYGYESGFEDAAKSLNNATQLAHEYKLEDLEVIFTKLYRQLSQCNVNNVPDAAFYDGYRDICDMLQAHFSKTITEKKIKHLQALIAKFSAKDQRRSEIPFSNRWSTFIHAARPILDMEKITINGARARLQQVASLALDSDIKWLADTLGHLDDCWDSYKESSAEAFIMLADELRAFPQEYIEESDIEQLNHERLRVLFTKKKDARPLSAYTVVKNALQLSEILIQQMDSPSLISSAKIQELLIDARQIKCHAIERIAEILLSLLERVPRGLDNCAVAESVVNALYFTAGFLQTSCSRLLKHLEHDPNSPSVASRQLFYRVLLSLYQTPGMPRDGVTWFIVKRLNSILSELQLVWMNTSTPTSTEYYCSLIRRLLQLATICELKEVRHVLQAHLDEIPQIDFVNTENRTMQRQCARIIRMIEDNCPKLTVVPSSNQVKLFFSKTIAALNQLLSSVDSQDPASLNAEISRVESRMSILGMTTDFPPVIAFIYELHHLAFDDSVDHKCLEDLLYQMINVANNICPEWVQPKEAELEFVKTYVPIPMPFFQDMLESLSVIHESLGGHAQDEPVAWERIQHLYNDVKSMVSYVPFALQMVSQNAQNRCRYLKKNIFIDIDTGGYPKASDLPTDSVRSVISVAFSSIVDKLVELIIDNAFVTTDVNSRITIILHPFPNEFSVSILHNGPQFTKQELLDRLSAAGIMPAIDDNIFDLLVSTSGLATTYPPVNSLAYILPILRQFDGHMDVALDQLGNTRFYVSFKI